MTSMPTHAKSGSAVSAVPILDLSPEIETMWDEIQEAIRRVLRSGQFILGPEGDAFEREVANYLGVRHAIGLNSGTDALVIALRALEIGPGDEVITTPFTFFATPEAISLVGATPVFVDAHPDDCNLDTDRIEEAITERTRALLPVHLFGRPARMGKIREIAERYNLRVIEDCAQSFGARFEGRHTGTLGDIGAYSFFPSKNLGAFGDGGLVATDDAALAERMRMLRTHGSKRKYENEMIGYNSRLDELHAAILRVKLPHIDEWNEARRSAARRYGDLLAEAAGVIPPDVSEGHVFHQYTVRIPGGRRNGVRQALASRGIQTMVYYPVPCHRLPVYAKGGAHMHVADDLASEVLSLPLWPRMDPIVQQRVATELEGALSRIEDQGIKPGVR
jgi:dTDP-4-amino-4,6-dideoxygalactose transaminase